MSSVVRPVTALRSLFVGPTFAAVMWQPPSIGKAPFTYQVLHRIHPSGAWISQGTTQLSISIISGLKPKTKYDIEVKATEST